MNTQQIVENEYRILSGSLYSAEWLEALTNRLTVENFTCPETRLIFATIDSLSKRDSEVTFGKISELIDPNEVPMPILLKLLAYAACGADLETLIVDIRNTSKIQKLRDMSIDVIGQIDNGLLSCDAICRGLENQLFGLNQDKTNKIIMPIDQILDKPIAFPEMLDAKITKYCSGDESFDGMKTNFTGLDKLIRGFRVGHFVIIGARPSVGKSSLLTNFVEKMTFNSGAKCLVFSLEMTKYEMVTKLVVQRARVPAEHFQTGNLDSSERQKLLDSYQAWKSQIAIFDDQASLAIDQIKSRALRAQRIHGINIVFVDYLQLITSKKNHESRQTEIADISRKLKEIAKELNIPIVALAQLNRKLEEREDKVPVLSDLKDSGALEADSDEVILLHRPELHDLNKRPGIIEVNVAKNRFGPIGKFDVFFDKPTGYMEDHASYYAR